jgi:hypothetical protein
VVGTTVTQLKDGTVKTVDGQALEVNSAYGTPSQYQDPRVFRFGVRGAF